MAESGVVTIGGDAGLSFHVRWCPPEKPKTAAEATWGVLAPLMDGVPVWEPAGASAPSFQWSLVDVIEHLAWSLPFISFEEGDPIGLDLPAHELRQAAEQRWMDIIERSLRVEEQRALRGFEDAHNLARAFEGVKVPDLWLHREGRLCRVVSGSRALMQPIAEVVAALDHLGDEIAGRLVSVGDERSRSALEAWAQRHGAATEEVVGIVANLTLADVRAISGSLGVEEAFGWSGSLDASELAVVARMAGRSLSRDALADLLRELRRTPPTRVSLPPSLVAEAEEAVRHIEHERPCDQGYALAEWYRSRFHDPDGPVEPEKETQRFGIPIREMEVLTPLLDAVCVWGPKHGPCIIVNRRGRHSQDKAGRRATIAHEVCHLLLDRQGALPVAEIRGGNVPRHVEARANAFAAELLLPRSIAGEQLARAGDWEGAVKRLCRRYGASREIVAWQVRNSGIPLDASVLSYLRSLVSEPDKF